MTFLLQFLNPRGVVDFRVWFEPLHWIVWPVFERAMCIRTIQLGPIRARTMWDYDVRKYG